MNKAKRTKKRQRRTQFSAYIKIAKLLERRARTIRKVAQRMDDALVGL